MKNQGVHTPKPGFHWVFPGVWVVGEPMVTISSRQFDQQFLGSRTESVGWNLCRVALPSHLDLAYRRVYQVARVQAQLTSLMRAAGCTPTSLSQSL